MKSFKFLFFILNIILISCTNRDGEIIDLINSVKKQNDDLTAQITSLKKTTDSAMVAITKVTVSQAVTDKKLDAIQADLKSVLAQISSLSTQMTAANADLASIKAKIDALQVKCAELVVQINLLNMSIFSTVRSKTGRIWMDRNLGATQVAMSPKDEKSYGYYYQWGRGNDGHQVSNSSTTSVRSQLDQPGHNLFILVPGPDNLDWKVSPNPNLWQGVSGINNVCPIGFRVPTNQEWQQEKNTWSSPNAEGGFTSVLRLPLPGGRTAQYGNLSEPGIGADYWTSSVQNDRRGVLVLTTNFADIYHDPGSYGYSVRCIKD